MAGGLRRRNGLFGGRVSETRVFVQSGNATTYIRLAPLTKVCLFMAAFALTGWVFVSLFVVTFNQVGSFRSTDPTVVLRDSYKARLESLAAERDQNASEARSAQGSFKKALEQISRQQTVILKSIEQRRELSMALDVMRSRLNDALEQRDAISEANSALLGRLEDAQERFASTHGSTQDLTDTLNAVSSALADAAEARDKAKRERDELEKQLADLELQKRVNSLRQDEMVSQLEQAVAMSFGPLEEMFSASSLNVDSILATIRRNYSGQGGPAGIVTVSSRSVGSDERSGRLNKVIEQLDEVNLMRIAATKIPYAMPVLNPFRFTSGFGYRRDPKGRGRRMHAGIDLAAPRGTPIHATADGIVTSAAYEGGYGRVVRIQHEFGFETVYAHQTKLLVEKGQKVSRGDVIGAMGSTGRSTGVHLHYEVRLNGSAVNPMTYLEAAKDVF
ncbi:MAG: DUF5930 domain-containing protein [Pseudomonadota bacterium]